MRRINKKIQALHRDAGLSLLELMVTISIISILALFAVLGMDVIYRERVSSATRELYATLQKARVDGIVIGPSTSVPDMLGAGIRFESSNRYVIFKFNDCDKSYDYDATGCGGQREEAETKTITMPSETVLKVGSADPNNDIVIFDRVGYARSDKWEVKTVALVIEHRSGFKKCVSINTNKIREGSWNGSACIEE